MNSRAIGSIHTRRLCRTALWVILGGWLGMASGCAGIPVQTAQAPVTAVPAYAAGGQAPVVPRPAAAGSLWSDNGILTDLYTNVKARQVGDIVTVKIVESSRASNSADTTTDRESTVTAGIDNFLGMENRYNNQPAKHPFFNPFAKIRGGLTSEFEGTGKTSRSGNMTAFVTASVVNVQPNGNLFIVGSREVTINNERQIMTVAGTIRSRDISPENVVLSTYIADARIVYSGTGVINERQRPGWLSRVLDEAWPF